ncbi:amino acid permease [Neosynechococcus sphagnicola]|uniref:amino acid permease n=1 Tax=Neosynechococcus sphagnicola TaxID=1501145 RepID=UPI001EF9FF02|nr:amino acid permease [Neosynechococcus sphagnicola]
MWAYILGLGFQTAPSSVLHADSPLISLGDFLGAPAAAIIIGFSACLCFFSAGLGSLNALARVGLTLGKEGLMPPIMTVIHPRYRTPVGALTVGMGGVMLITIILITLGLPPLQINDVCGTFGTLALLLVYGLVALSLLPYLYRLGELNRKYLLLGGGTALLLLMVTTIFLSSLGKGAVLDAVRLFFGLLMVGIGLIAWQQRPQRPQA